MLVILVYDAVANTSGGTLPTVSERIFAWSQRYPMLPLLVGVVIGHLFFPIRPISPP
jgi:hypothetical protein